MEDRVNLSNISITKIFFFLLQQTKEKKSLRGCRPYVSWNIGSIVHGVFWKWKEIETNNNSTKADLLYECSNVYM